ncbi:hypothetical protein [Treponema sp.]|jgi:hypothetical protein|uniref:hypothetical protein n=1 Tax=Treponema sp. TaxID=166 RepID=UPI00257A479F|nr:hypothetical protein [Treponema sp.]MBE6353696.1 hypothetical protein [Treponema sp.]
MKRLRWLAVPAMAAVAFGMVGCSDGSSKDETESAVYYNADISFNNPWSGCFVTEWKDGAFAGKSVDSLKAVLKVSGIGESGSEGYFTMTAQDTSNWSTKNTAVQKVSEDETEYTFQIDFDSTHALTASTQGDDTQPGLNWYLKSDSAKDYWDETVIDDISFDVKVYAGVNGEATYDTVTPTMEAVAGTLAATTSWDDDAKVGVSTSDGSTLLVIDLGEGNEIDASAASGLVIVGKFATANNGSDTSTLKVAFAGESISKEADFPSSSATVTVTTPKAGEGESSYASFETDETQYIRLDYSKFPVSTGTYRYIIIANDSSNGWGWASVYYDSLQAAAENQTRQTTVMNWTELTLIENTAAEGEDANGAVLKLREVTE